MNYTPGCIANLKRLAHNSISSKGHFEYLQCLLCAKHCAKCKRNKNKNKMVADKTNSNYFYPKR